ncbi:MULTISPECIES: NAD(+) diphosphatase [unclassified Novosphingobium]|uniref:NAD(+) diphosphatase n=1 Tax=unclassified Novosphingobium TaxID=2644732 RepID=UPI00146F5B33|nr:MULTISPECIES: NAD(+) diphosphatase [unclassified Novosphingobium]NMN03342.1 NAD+ diphosphatase [Novosphingobium sp. SG919]NMN86668.1 NAD+ diphosphatase [Novosphingobium sp. SG916]
MTDTATLTAGLHKALPPIAYAGNPLDRADAVRTDPARLAAVQAAAGARLLVLDGLSPEFSAEGGLVWAPLAAAPEGADLVFLGLDPQGHGCFAAVAPALGGSTAPAAPNLRAMLDAMPAADLAIYGGARSLVDWHARHRFCARCGHATRAAKGGWQRSCANAACGAEHFPRVDPVTIMLVEHDGRLLLGRQPRFPAGRYSALAGFVEPGETVEEAVAREVLEEAGVRVRDVRYVASQPWPYPSSLMIACHALADDPAIAIDHAELEDARWFTRAEVTAALEGRPDAPFGAPTHTAVARHLLEWWMVARG